MKTFDLIAEVMDYGESVTKLIVDLNEEAKLEDFTLSAKNLNQEDQVYYEGPIEILSVEKTECGKTVLNLKYGFEEKPTASIYYNIVLEDGVWNFFLSYNLELKLHYTLTYKGEALKQGQLIRPLVDQFAFCKTELGLPYRLFTPTIKAEKHPLIVWIHGSGEGGCNNSAQILANKGGTGFATKEAQEIFGGAYIAAPQSDYNWSVDPEGVKNIDIPLPKVIKASRDYVPEVLGMIEEILKAHDDIDPKRVYISGCSAGGAMTWKTVLRSPETFACAVPICGSAPTIEELKTVIDLPIWMVHSEDDTTVACKNSVDNYENLKKLGGHVHLTTYPNVTSLGIKYPGHWSWIYALNNEPALEDGTSLFHWMALQTK